MMFPRVALWTLLLGMVVSCYAAADPDTPTPGTAAATTSTSSSSTPTPYSTTTVTSTDNNTSASNVTASTNATTITVPANTIVTNSTTTLATTTLNTSLTTSTAAPPATTAVTTVTTTTTSPVVTTTNSSATTVNTATTAPATTVTTAPATTVTSTTAPVTTVTTTAPVTTVTTTASPITATTNTVPTTTPASLPTTTSAAQTTPSSSAPTTAVVSPSVIISETNILLNSGKIYVELSGPKHSFLSKLTVAVFNASSKAAIRLFEWNSTVETFDDSGLLVVNVTSNSLEDVLAALVVLYRLESYYTGNYNSLIPGLDHVLVATNDTGIASNLCEELCLDKSGSYNKSVMFINSTEATSKVLSLTRCQDKDAFLLLPSSRGKVNNCSLQDPQSYILKMTVPRSIVCDEVKKITNIQWNIAVEFFKDFNKYLCGVDFLQLSGNLSCVDGSLLWNFTFQPSYKGQTALFQAKFQTYVAGGKTIQVGDKTLTVENCMEWKVCYASPVRPPADTNNSRVTVAVVLSFIAVFLVLLIGVIIYIRRKKYGIMRQFRMTRLQEDDDMDDMDDFVGGGFNQEPNFDGRNN